MNTAHAGPATRRPPSPVATSRPSRRSVAVLATAALVILASCSGSSPKQSVKTTPPSDVSITAPQTDAIPEAKWADIDTALAKLGPKTSMLVASVTPDGTCRPVHAVAASAVHPMASQFKLLVLGALAEQIDAGKVSWNQKVTVPKERSLGNEGAPGALQAAPENAQFTVEHVATQMISISDNTAADMLIDLVGRKAVERQFARWTDHADRNIPLLTTREMLLLHYATGLGGEYLATPRAGRASFLADKVDPRPISDIGSGYTTEPRFIDKIEWFADAQDLCRTFAGLQQLEQKSGLGQLDGVLSKEDFGVDLDPAQWPTVWYKGGSEPGVLTTGWLATTANGDTYVVEIMIANPDEALGDDAIPTDVQLAKDTFALLASS